MSCKGLWFCQQMRGLWVLFWIFSLHYHDFKFFLLLTVILFFSQYFYSLFKHCCKPFFVSDIRTRSSAKRRWLRESFKMLGSWHWSWSKMSLISLLKRLKSIGLRLHPCFSPVLDGKCVMPLGRCILSLLFTYIHIF